MTNESEVEIAEKILNRKVLWDWNDGGDTVFLGESVKLSPILFVQVVPSFESTDIGEINKGEPMHFMGLTRKNQKTEDDCSVESLVTEFLTELRASSELKKESKKVEHDKRINLGSTPVTRIFSGTPII